MRRTAAQRRKDKTRNMLRKLRKAKAALPPRGRTRFTAILDDAATFFSRAGCVAPISRFIPMHKSVEEYFDDMDKELAKLPESDRTKENEAILLANIIRDGLGLPALPLSKGKDDG